MKFQVFAILVFLGIFGNSYARVTSKMAPIAIESRVFGGSILAQDNPYRQGFTVLFLYFEDKNALGKSAYECSGTIITDKYVLSTAFCLENNGLETDIFYVGITGLKGGRHETTVTEVKFAEGFVSSTQKNNVALAKVLDPYPLNTGDFFVPYLPKKYWGVDEFTGDRLQVCGYRDPYTTDNTYVVEPTCYFFYPRTRDYCTKTYNLPLRANEMCASSGDVSKFAVCSRDFGAGLMYIDDDGKFHLYAMASYTYPYECAKAPTAFIILSKFLKWIKKNAV